MKKKLFWVEETEQADLSNRTPVFWGIAWSLVGKEQRKHKRVTDMFIKLRLGHILAYFWMFSHSEIFFP